MRYIWDLKQGKNLKVLTAELSGPSASEVAVSLVNERTAGQESFLHVCAGIPRHSEYAKALSTEIDVALLFKKVLMEVQWDTEGRGSLYSRRLILLVRLHSLRSKLATLTPKTRLT